MPLKIYSKNVKIMGLEAEKGLKNYYKRNEEHFNFYS